MKPVKKVIQPEPLKPIWTPEPPKQPDYPSYRDCDVPVDNGPQRESYPVDDSQNYGEDIIDQITNSLSKPVKKSKLIISKPESTSGLSDLQMKVFSVA